ncbi:hypothetical protein GBAR_LOCUS14041 [Geodia barretti]|uniref:Uncharacterized protein n=1 Tax=Geodia barretti TaxID=519541 RepID=A0AA35WJU8_GEOBA|nr:hypothetical protein GBAR_LOCUS14041 [Geodia barretti]
MLALVLSVFALLWCSVLTYASETEELFLPSLDEKYDIIQAEHKDSPILTKSSFGIVVHSSECMNGIISLMTVDFVERIAFLKN